MLKKKIWVNFQRIIEVFTQKTFTKLSKVWVWDPGSGKNLFQIPDPDPGVKKAPDPDPGVKKAPDPDPQYCFGQSSHFCCIDLYLV
jgi:hypothetical protein